MKRILVVDNDVRLLKLLQATLQLYADCEVRIEDYAPRAAATAQQFNPDLIILDMVMPGLDGGQVARAIRANPEFASTPVLFLTSLVTRHEIKARGGLIGGEHYLSKPVDPDELFAKVTELLGS